MKDFTEALKTRKASCGRAYIRETVNVAWDEVGGLDEVKSELAREVIAPIRYRHVASQLGVKPPTGILLYGPPGNGKTHLAKAVSAQLGWPIISKRGAELTSKYLGETQKNIDDLFRAALTNAPATVHLDEIDSLAPKRVAGGDSASQERSSAVNTLLESIDKITDARSQILLIFTTNRIDILDDAFLRSGRVEGHYYVGSPDERGREAVFRIYARNYQTREIDYKELAKKTEGFTPADIKRILEEASRTSFATALLNHESLPHSTSFFKDLMEGRSPKDKPEPQTSIKVAPVTMQDLFMAIEKLQSQNLKRRS
jgi:transitional endoplasmic reticulum ATPase